MWLKAEPQRGKNICLRERKQTNKQTNSKQRNNHGLGRHGKVRDLQLLPPPGNVFVQEDWPSAVLVEIREIRAHRLTKFKEIHPLVLVDHLYRGFFLLRYKGGVRGLMEDRMIRKNT